ncbi:hypothetical protein [Pontibacter rugosus]|uniref:Uncharacterized protein n=1 Tax=Pontibacter rugosus TaxID=1745966 RepID=A0ABW3SLX0_9BACT
MITAINIETNLWNRIINLLKFTNWVETYRYDEFDAGIDFDFAVLENDGEEVLFGWDNWVEGEIHCSESRMKKIESLVGEILKKGEPVNLKPEVIKLYKPATKGKKT